jgi:succinate dehydrogenase hydrophobic anchor subunit
VELSPRAVAAEKNIDLSTLRDIANLSAENALGRHETVKSRLAMRSKAVVALMALIVGLGLLWLGRTHSNDKLFQTIAAVVLVVAAIYGLQYAILKARAKKNRADRRAMQKLREDRKPNVAAEEAGRMDDKPAGTPREEVKTSEP